MGTRRSDVEQDRAGHPRHGLGCTSKTPHKGRNTFNPTEQPGRSAGLFSCPEEDTMHAQLTMLRASGNSDTVTVQLDHTRTKPRDGSEGEERYRFGGLIADG